MKTKWLIAACLATAVTLSGNAATRVFTNTTTSNALWMTAANWNAAPAAADSAVIVSNSSVLLTGANATVSSLYLGYLTSAYVGGGALTLSNATLTTMGAVYLGLTTLVNSTAQNATLSLTNNSYLYVGSSAFSIGRGYNATISNTNYDAYLNVDKTSSIASATTLEIGRRYGRGFLTLEGDATSGAIVTANLLNMSVENGTGSITMGTNSRLTVGTANIGTNSSIVNNGGTLSIGNSLTATSSTINASGSKINIAGDYTASSAVLSVSGTTVTIGGRFFGVASSSFLNGSYLSASVWESQNASARTTISGSTFSIGSTSATTWLTAQGTTGHTTISNGTLIIGANGKANLGRTSFSGSVLSMSNGAQLMSGTTFSFLTSTGVIDTSTVTVGSTTGAFTVGAGSQLNIANASAITVTGSATGTIASTISVLGTFNVATTSLVSVGGLLNTTGTLSVATSSQFSVGGNADVSGLLNVAASSTLGVVGNVSITGAGAANVATSSTLSVGGLLSLTGTASLNLIGSYLTVGSTLSQDSDYNKLNLTNSIMMVNGVIYHDSSAGNVWTNSTVSATGWENRFSAARTTLSGSVVTLTSATQVALTGDTSTGYVYLSNGSKLAVTTNSSLLTGRLYVGLTSGTSTFESTANTTTIAARLAIGYTGSTGIVTVSNGTIYMRPDLFATEVVIGNGGTGSLYVSGTGVITGVETTEVSANSTFSGSLYVGTLPGSLPTSYVSTQTLSLEGGAALRGNINVASDGIVKLAVVGAPASFVAVTAETVAFDSNAALTVNFTGATISGPVSIRLVLADALTGLNFSNIVTLGLDTTTYQVAYSQQALGDQTALIASISLIPEPAVSALFVGLLGALAVIRRRRR